MKKYPSRRFILTTSILLSVFYFIFLYPVSGIVGGALYVFGGKFIPSIVNLLITFLVVSLFGGIYWIYKVFLFILISFILGMNTHLFYLKNIKPTNVELTVTHPLQNPISIKNSIIDVYWENGVDVYANPLYFSEFSADEGCMCSYFSTPPYLFRGNIKSLSEKDSPEGIYKIFAPDKLLLASTNFPKSANYFLQSSKQDIGFGKVKLTINIRDKMNGYATISGIYPKGIIINDTKNYRAKMDPNFLRKSFELFMHDNFWNNYISQIASPKTESLFNLLTDEEIKKLFIN